ncbi:MAG: ATP-dependent DNA ligase [Planctomycetota bacterium]|nr:MAG: ATP-dependent DNA ligase [Planctomycetota bacterium]
MKPFTELSWRLDAAAEAHDTRAALVDYFRSVPAEDAPTALKILCGRKQSRSISVADLREWATEAAGIPSWLVDECHAHVGDLAETLALILPVAETPGSNQEIPPAPGLTAALLGTADRLQTADGAARKKIVESMWRLLQPQERVVWHKLLCGTFRIVVPQTLLASALAEVAGIDGPQMLERLEARALDSAADYCDLMAPGTAAVRRGPHPFAAPVALDSSIGAAADRPDWQVEWKWEGIRAQVVCRGGVALWTREEELVSDRFPEVVAAAAGLPDSTVLDGVLLALRGSQITGGMALPPRRTRQTLLPRLRSESPWAFVAFDLLEVGGTDLRAEPLAARRDALESLCEDHGHPLLDPLPAAGLLPCPVTPASRLWLSPLLPAPDWSAVEALHASARDRAVGGLVLKPRCGAYATTVTDQLWWAWAVDPLEIDAVLIAAVAGSGRGKRLNSEYAFGVWHNARLVRIASARVGLTDEELAEIDGIVRATIQEKKGPWRGVTPTLVMRLAFRGVAVSTRHESGVVVRSPRIAIWRKNVLPAEAGTLDQLRALIEPGADSLSFQAPLSPPDPQKRLWDD